MRKEEPIPITAQRQKPAKTIERLGGCFDTLSVALIFLAIGAGLSFWGWNILNNAKASISWPTAQGEIIKSQVTHRSNSDGDSYSPEVTYTYPVNSRSYKSYTIKFGENSYDSKRRAEEIAASYQVGNNVTVYYDPKNPGNSVLEPGVSSGSYIVLGIGLLFLTIGLIAPPIAFFFRGRQ
jgi:hypothetical protein